MTGTAAQATASGGIGLRVQVLGQLRVTVDGEPVPVRGKFRRRLVLALVAAATPLAAEELGDRMYEPGEERESANAVHAHVSRFRRLIDPEGAGRGAQWLESVGGRYRLAADEVDLTAAEHALRDIEAGIDLDPRGACEALYLLLGSVAPAVPDDAPGWSDAARAWNLRLLGAQDTWSDLVVSAGDAAVHADAILALARAEPTREVRWSLAMRALARAGRQGDALAAYQEARHILHDELGIEPGAQLRYTHGAILRTDATLAAVRTRPGVRPVPRAATAFFGRSDALADLERDANRHQIVTVLGIGGVGKSRLVSEWIQRSGRSGAALWVDLHGVNSTGVLMRIASQLGLRVEMSGMAMETILYALPSTPTVLVLDNAEGVSDEVAGAVAVLTAQVPELTVVVTSRLPLGVTGEHLRALAPLAMDSPELIELAVDRVGGSPDPQMVRMLARRSGGLPLSLELLAAGGADEGLTEGADAVPSLGVIVADAIAALSAEARTTLAAARFLPAGASAPLIAALMKRESRDPRVRGVVRELVQSSLLSTSSRLGHGGTPGLRYRVLEPVADLSSAWAPPEPGPAHTFERLLTWSRGRLHQRGEVPLPGPIADVASELINLDAAIDYWLDHERAAATRAILDLDAVWAWLGRSALVLDHLEAELAVPADRGLDPEDRARAVLATSTGRGLATTALKVDALNGALAALPDDADPVLRASLSGLQAVGLGWQGELSACGEALEFARGCLRGRDLPWMEAQVDQVDALLWATRDQPGRGVGELQAIAERFAKMGDPNGQAIAYHYSITMARLASDPRLGELIRMGVAASHASGSPATIALLAGEEARFALAEAEQTGATPRSSVIARLDRAISEIERVGNLRTAAVTRRELGLYLLRCDDFARAEHELRIAAQRLLHLDRGAAALAVGGLSVMYTGATSRQLAAGAWGLCGGGGTPLLGAERQRLVELTGVEPLPAGGSTPEVISDLARLLDLNVLELSA